MADRESKDSLTSLGRIFGTTKPESFLFSFEILKWWAVRSARDENEGDALKSRVDGLEFLKFIFGIVKPEGELLFSDVFRWCDVRSARESKEGLELESKGCEIFGIVIDRKGFPFALSLILRSFVGFRLKIELVLLLE